MSEKEAWEYIAGELPPGCGRTRAGWRGYGYETDDPGKLWARFSDHTGWTKRAYAELIAPERVREAAEKALGDDLRSVEMSDEVKQGRGAWFLVYTHRDDEGWPREYTRGHGPTICDAAWAAIQALGGGE